MNGVISSIMRNMSKKLNGLVALACTLLASQQVLPVMHDLCSIIVTFNLNSQCRTFWTADGASMSAAEQPSFCTKLLTDATVARV